MAVRVRAFWFARPARAALAPGSVAALDAPGSVVALDAPGSVAATPVVVVMDPQ
jgi:hypothetical protein